MDKYADFMSQIPTDVMRGVERRFCSEVAIFKPKTYVTGVLMHSSDYHVIVPASAPPDTYINGRLVSMEAGKFVSFNPGDSVMCAQSRPTKQYQALLIKPELVGRIAAEMDFEGEVRFLKPQNAFSADLLQAINAFDREAGREERLDLMLDCIGIQIAALDAAGIQNKHSEYAVDSPDLGSYVHTAVAYMREFYSANITLEDICREINVSPFHFVRVFKQKTGVSPHQYLMNIRIEKAAKLLRSRRYSVTEAGRLCGFVNLSHFSKTFKQKPACLRRNSGNRISDGSNFSKTQRVNYAKEITAALTIMEAKVEGAMFMKRKVFALTLVFLMAMLLPGTAAAAGDQPYTLAAPTNLTAALKYDAEGVPYFELKLNVPQSVVDVNNKIRNDGYPGIISDEVSIQFDYKYGDYDWNEGNSLYWDTSTYLTGYLSTGSYDYYPWGEEGPSGEFNMEAEVYQFRAYFFAAWGYEGDWVDKTVQSGYSNTVTIGNPSYYSGASSWAEAELDRALEYGFITDRIRDNMGAGITREEFAEVAVKMYEKYTGKTASYTDMTRVFRHTESRDIQSLRAGNRQRHGKQTVRSESSDHTGPDGGYAVQARSGNRTRYGFLGRGRPAIRR